MKKCKKKKKSKKKRISKITFGFSMQTKKAKLCQKILN